jgi:Na+-driven multidrug efflux pump
MGWGPIPALGIQGAAIATTIGRGVGVAVQIWALAKGGKHIQAKLSQLVLETKILMKIVRTSLGGLGQMLVGMTSWIFLMRILADVGSEAVAGSTIALRIMLFTMMPAWGLSNAAATLVGQNLGAGFPDRAESSVWKIGLYNMGFLIAVSLIYYFFNNSLMGLFTDNQNVIAIGGEWLRILAYSYFVYGWWMVTVQAFNGSGDTRTPTKINVVFFWLIQIPLAYWLAIGLDWQHSGVFWAVFVSETGAGLVTLWLFTRGKWKKTQV